MNNDINNSAAKKSAPRQMAKYGAVVTAIVLAILIVVNVLVYTIPSEFTMFDTEQTTWTEITEETANFIASVDMPVKLYVLAEGGELDYRFNTLLTKYSDANSNITYEVIDPIEQPNFIKPYTDATLPNNSMIVESELRHIVINADDMIYYMSETVNTIAETEIKMGYDDLSAAREMYYSQYGIDIYYDTQQYFCAETVITSRIDYVTIDRIPHAYILETTGDKALSEQLMSLIASANIETADLSLKSAKAVPEDADCIIIYAPKDDISDGEYTKIEKYIKAGGSVFMMTNIENSAHKNINRIAALFGCTAQEGMVCDPDKDHNHEGTRNILLPDILGKHDVTTSNLANGYVVQIPNAHGIAIADKLPENVSAEAMFYTTSSGFRVSADKDENKLCDNSVQNVGVVAEMKISDDVSSGFIWVGSADAFTDEYAQNSSGGNYMYLASGLRWMTDTFTSEYVAIPGTNLSANYLNGITSVAPVLFWGAIIVILIPASILTAGLVIWIRRRRS